MARYKHPIAVIEAAVAYAESEGWRYIKAGRSSHAWGRLYCPENSRDGCKMSIWSTPRNPHDFAKQIRRQVEIYPHQEIQRDE